MKDSCPECGKLMTVGTYVSKEDSKFDFGAYQWMRCECGVRVKSIE